MMKKGNENNNSNSDFIDLSEVEEIMTAAATEEERQRNIVRRNRRKLTNEEKMPDSELVYPRRKKTIASEDPYAIATAQFSVHPNDLIEFRKILFANSLSVQIFLEHIVNQVIGKKVEMNQFLKGAMEDQVKKTRNYAVRYNKTYSAETEAEMLYQLLADKDEEENLE